MQVDVSDLDGSVVFFKGKLYRIVEWSTFEHDVENSYFILKEIL